MNKEEVLIDLNNQIFNVVESKEMANNLWRATEKLVNDSNLSEELIYTLVSMKMEEANFINSAMNGMFGSHESPVDDSDEF